jgi:hypothetical protein
MSNDPMRVACICVAGILTATVVSCSKEHGLLPQIHVGDVTGVITTPVLLDQELHQCSRMTPAGDATPALLSQPDLKEFESGVTAYVASHPPARTNDRVEELGLYHRRYAGLNRNGHRRMYVSFITADLSGARSDWRAPNFGACDGGVNFFGVEYDLDAHEFTHIAYNGAL